MPLRLSWIETANSPETPFPLNNLPYGRVSFANGSPRCAVPIGDLALDVSALERAGLLVLDGGPALQTGGWNELMARGPACWAALRARLAELLAEDAPEREQLTPFLRPLAEATPLLPFEVTEYTDFYAGRHHATNVGTMFRGADNALPPNWLHIPIGYNGRASTVVVSGTDIRRPCGQLKPKDAEIPHWGASQRLDFELEMGAIIGGATQMGERLTADEADALIFGYVLLNDWSARDIQAWEYQPLGPFQAKAFGTSISPWIVPKAALEPFRTDTPPRDHALLPYLQTNSPTLYDIQLQVDLQPDGAERATTVSRTNYREMYYSSAQQLAHHSSSGCAMRVGDLLGSGTISGPNRESRGSMLEISWGGRDPITLATGETRSFLEDGDLVVLRGEAVGDGFRVGFGECAGRVRPAQM
ncbi:MAG: fumarylacetoacetase [Neomegalonema sp.]|nr:fumarylacetoacetase [Neomegalonema sp.]